MTSNTSSFSTTPRLHDERLDDVLRGATPDVVVVLLFVDVDHLADQRPARPRRRRSRARRRRDALCGILRRGDLVARFGGDEFTVLLHSVSVGLSVSRGRSTSADDLLRQADQAMYRAKRSGRARWESFNAAPAPIS